MCKCVWGYKYLPQGSPPHQMKSLPLCMARHATANHRPQEDKPDVRGRERGQQGEVGSPQERDEQNLKQRKETY